MGSEAFPRSREGPWDSSVVRFGHGEMFYGNRCLEAKKTITAQKITKSIYLLNWKCFAKCKITSQGLGLRIGIVAALH